jgi:hypothetical protein
MREGAKFLKGRFGKPPLRLRSGQAPPTREPRVLPRSLLRREGGDDIFEARVAPQGVPLG